MYACEQAYIANCGLIFFHNVNQNNWIAYTCLMYCNSDRF